MSCESFETQAQNKRYLGDLVEVMIKQARDTADDFVDVPTDFRHHRPRKARRFPEQWKMTAERRKYLDDVRRRNGVTWQIAPPVDGKKVLEEVIAGSEIEQNVSRLSSIKSEIVRPRMQRI